MPGGVRPVGIARCRDFSCRLDSLNRHRLGVELQFRHEGRAPGRTASETRLAMLARTAAAMSAWEIPAAAWGPARTPVPAAIVVKIAMPIVPPISWPVELRPEIIPASVSRAPVIAEPQI